MSKIKVGDIVRLKDSAYTDYHAIVGVLGKVVGLSNKDEGWLKIIAPAFRDQPIEFEIKTELELLENVPELIKIIHGID